MCPAVPMMSGMLGGCPGNHGGCGERSGGARRQPRCQMAARSSLLRRPTPGARPARRTSSVVAALAALAPRLVRLAHHDYSDRLLATALVMTAAVLALMARGTALGATTSYNVVSDVTIPMSDGVMLDSDAYIPTTGCACLTILVLTTYRTC